MSNINKAILKLNVYDANRIDTDEARTGDSHYDMKTLVTIGLNSTISHQIDNLDWCAKEGEDDIALTTIRNVANALLSAYQIQRDSYHKE